jgi:hypothetical protein
MLRSATVILAILLISCSGLSVTAFASGGVGGGDAFRSHHIGRGFGVTPRENYGGYGNPSRSLRSEFRGYGGRDVWGHWGTYYGPMVSVAVL